MCYLLLLSLISEHDTWPSTNFTHINEFCGTNFLKWFNCKQESQKLALAESTGLDQKQINNWFINQRKRHWKPSEDMQFVVMDAAHPHYYMDNAFPMDMSISRTLLWELFVWFHRLILDANKLVYISNVHLSSIIIGSCICIQLVCMWLPSSGNIFNLADHLSVRICYF